MKKSSLVLMAIAIASLQSCRSDPNGPGSSDPVIMASVVDSSLVDVAGVWRLVSTPASNVSLSISSASVRSFLGSQLKYEGLIDRRFNRSLITKKGGVERMATVYGVNINDRPFSVAVYSQDSIWFGPCDEDTLSSVDGPYIRTK